MVPARLIPALMITYGLVGLTATAQAAPKALSLQEAISIALEKNLQVKISRATQELGQYGIQSSLGVYDWGLSSTLNFNRNIADARVRETNDPSLGHVLTTTNSTNLERDWTVTVNKPFEWGGSFNASYSPVFNYTSSSVLYNQLDPPNAQVTRGSASAFPYTGGLSVRYTQSMLKNFGRDVAGAGLIIARLNQQSSDLTFQKSIIQLVSDTETQYWDLVYAQRNLQNKKLALELVQKQLRENQIRVDVGTMAPIEVTSAEAAVARAEQDIITAENALANAKDILLRQLYADQERPADLQLKDGPNPTTLTVNEETAQKMALESRVELKIAKLTLDNAKVNENVAVQNRLPQLDVNVGMTASANQEKAYMDVNKDLGQRKNPGYSLGITFAVPIQNRAAKATLSSARANRRSSELSLRDLQLSTALEVRTAFRGVETAKKGVDAAIKSRVFSEKDLDAEQKKFENGMSTNFVVLSKQSALDAARASELQAQITYAKAVTAFEKSVGNLLPARQLTIK
jgi:outer membrane protein